MTDSILIGATIGYIVFVLIVELKLKKLCRLCSVWWFSVIAATFLWNPLTIGVINVVAHVTFLILTRVTNDDASETVGIPTCREARDSQECAKREADKE